MAEDFHADIESVKRIEAVPTILDVVRRVTGMRFVAVARVTTERWIACSVLDEIGFGLKPGGELKVDTTICHEIRQSRQPVIIDHVAEDAQWCHHETPRTYGFQSYISMPILLADGSFFGTLCAIDPLPARVRTPETMGMFRLFAELIAKHLDASRKLAATESALLEERAVARLRDEFIAVLGHDLRTPMRGISCLLEVLLTTPLNAEAMATGRLIRDSAARMRGLIDNMLDLAHSRSGGGLPLTRDAAEPLEPVLREVIAELSAIYPERIVLTDFRIGGSVDCDRGRIAQLFSNLLGNAFSYGATGEPIHVRAACFPDAFELCVSNAGEPIPPVALDRLFQPFYRNAMLQNREGLGLGLHIAHQIATAHGGTLTVSSTAAETCFTFRMPLIQQQASILPAD